MSKTVSAVRRGALVGTLPPQTYRTGIFSRPDDTWLVEGNSVNSSENCCKDLKISVSVISRLLEILSSGREMAMPTGVVKADFLKAVIMFSKSLLISDHRLLTSV